MSKLKTYSLIFIVQVSSFLAFGQTPKDTITLSEILLKAASYEDSSFVYDGYFIKHVPSTVRKGQRISELELIIDDIKVNPNNYSKIIELDSANQLIIKSAITIRNYFSDDRLSFDHLTFLKRFHIAIEENKELFIYGCNFNENVVLKLKKRSILTISNSLLNQLHVQRTSEVGESYVEIEECHFRGSTIEKWYSKDVNIDTVINVFFEDQLLGIDFDTLIYTPSISLSVYGDLIFEKNSIDTSVELATIYGETRNLVIDNNLLNGLFLMNVEVSKRVTIQNNKGDYFFELKDLKMNDANQEIDYDQIKSMKLVDRFPLMETVFTKNNLPLNVDRMYGVFNGSFFYPSLQIEYDRLMSVYRKLYQGFRNNGNERYANALYVELKEIETIRLEYLAKKGGSFKNWTEWRLNQLLSVYTVYGTDPSGAIVGSFYIILLFGIFYFFFPSEWDTKSKTQLVTDFKIFVKKNEHGYFKPFFILLKGFLLSLINALMLSLNAFVTLGFGTIPTTGLARYVCIIQGFIGWFLLSIFTVALINQVLF